MNYAVGIKTKNTKEVKSRTTDRFWLEKARLCYEIDTEKNEPAGNTVLWKHADPGVMWWADCFRARILPSRIPERKIDLIERIHRKRRGHMRQACSYMLVDWNIEIIHNVHLDLIRVRWKSCRKRRIVQNLIAMNHFVCSGLATRGVVERVRAVTAIVTSQHNARNCKCRVNMCVVAQVEAFSPNGNCPLTWCPDGLP